MRDIIGELGKLRGRTRWLLVLQRTTALGAWMIGVLIGLALLDYALRFPGGVRLMLLLGGLAGVGWFCWRFVLPVLGYAPSMTDIALRVEQVIPRLSGRLASSVEFASDIAYRDNPLAARSIRDTESRVQGETLRKVIDTRRTRRDVAAFIMTAGIAAIVAIVSPASAQTGLARILLPFGSATWPARTAIESLMIGIDVHARGQALPLRVRGTKAPGGQIEHMDIRANYRLRTADGFGKWREIALMHQGGALYESLVDTQADAVEFFFSTADWRIDRQTIRLAPPPAVVSATLSISPPEYARGHVSNRLLALGPGIDERAVTDEPSLVGSQITLALSFNKPIPVPSDAAARAEWIGQTFGWPDDAPLPRLDAAGAAAESVTLDWRLAETTTLVLHLRDQDGLENIEEIAYRIDAVNDRPPSITITEPESDQAVLATALVPLAAEGRDDVAIDEVGLIAALQPKPGAETPVPLWQTSEASAEPVAALRHDLDLKQYELGVGDVIEVLATAADNFYLDGQSHDPARSPVRRLRIISERDFAASVFQELKALRENAIRLEAQQAGLQDDIIDDGVQPGVQRAQSRISERIAEQIEALQRVTRRTEMNRFEDQQIESLVDQADDLLTHAGRASNEASDAIERRERAGQPAPAEQDPDDEAPQGDPSQVDADQPSAQAGEPGRSEEQPKAGAEPGEEGAAPQDEPRADDLEVREPAEEDRPVVDAQQKVRDELRDLIELLDRNEDTWIMNQRINDLLDEQTRLQAETQRLSNQTLGRSRDELEAAELSELDRIGQKQTELAEKARDLIDDLRERADDMEAVDPQAADAQRQAASVGEQREVDRNMENAASSAEQNQLQNAQNSQQRAREGLQAMADNLDRKRAQAEELMRRLASLIESIKRLVTVQESELAALAKAQDGGDFFGRDRAMIRLNQNTQAVSGEARAAGREADRIARALDRAADAQAAAVGSLREDPIDPDGADAAENRSLDLLNEAVTLAEELEKQTQDDLIEQRREELVKAYHELMERQVALRADTLDLQALDQLSRRELVEARGQGNRQEEIRQALDEIRVQTQEISESLVFSHVHRLMDEWSATISERLHEGDVSASVTDLEMSIAEALEQLAKALEEEQLDPNEFEEGGGGGGGGGQGQTPPLVPPIAELKLLRGMQEHIYHRTRDIDGRDDFAEAARRQRLRELGREQKDLLDLGEQMMEQLTGGQQGNPGDQPKDDGGPQ